MRDALLAIAQEVDGQVERCGLLLGAGDRVVALRLVPNRAPAASTAFLLDHSAQIDAARSARGGGLAIIGVWHTHPRGSATPSATDIAGMRAGEPWLIATAAEVRAWRRRDGSVRPLPLVID